MPADTMRERRRGRLSNGSRSFRVACEFSRTSSEDRESTPSMLVSSKSSRLFSSSANFRVKLFLALAILLSYETA